jgi:hypothetical protein
MLDYHVLSQKLASFEFFVALEAFPRLFTLFTFLSLTNKFLYLLS